MIILLLSCLAYKTTLIGVVDDVGEDRESCTIVLENSDIVIVKSRACKYVNEGEFIHFYLRKK